MVHVLSFKSYIIRRILFTIPVIIFTILLTFTLVHIAPGDPVHYLLGETFVSKDYETMIRTKFGLDKPLFDQFIIYILQILKGDFGYSFINGCSVLELILSKFPATLLLLLTSLIFSTIFGLILGIISSRNPFSVKDSFITAISMLGYSLPVFWIGILLILVFSVNLHLFPTGGMQALELGYTIYDIGYYIDIMKHLFLPALTLGICGAAGGLGLTVRLIRSSMLEALSQDYIITARSKGLDENTVFYKHALRNAIMPVLTITGTRLGLLFSGTILTERIFSWPGLGRLLYDSILLKDYPVLIGIFFFIVLGLVIANVITDILYGLLNPKIRYR